MVTVHQLSRPDARRIAVRAQLLAKDRPSDLLDTVRHLTVVQLDPTSPIAPSAGRLGPSYAYAPQDLRDAIDEQVAVDLRGMVMRAWRSRCPGRPGGDHAVGGDVRTGA